MKTSRLAAAWAAAALCACLCLAETAAPAAPYTIQDELRRWIPLNQTTVCAFSADGRLVAILVKRLIDQQRSDVENPGSFGGRYSGSQIFVVDVATGERQQVSQPGALSYGVSWAPDGNSLAYYANVQGALRLWLWDRKTRASRQLGVPPLHTWSPSDLPAWSPDSRTVMVRTMQAEASASAAPRRDPAKDQGVKVFAFEPSRAHIGVDRADTVARRFATSQWVLFDISKNTSHVLMTGRPVEVMRFSPDGRSVAGLEFTGRGQEREGDTLRRLVVWNLKTGSERVIARDILQYGAILPSWSPDSTRIAFTTSELAQRSDLSVVDVSTGRRVAHVPQIQDQADGTGRYWTMGPVWSPDGKRLFALSRRGLIALHVGGEQSVRRYEVEGREIIDLPASGNGTLLSGRGLGKKDLLVTTFEANAGRVGHARLDLETGRSEPLWSELGAKLSAAAGTYFADLSLDETRWVFVNESSHEPPDFWLAEAPFKTVRRLSALNAALANIELGRSQRIDFLSSDGVPLKAMLLLPVGYQPGTPVPLIVDVYPGKNSESGGDFGGLTAQGPMNRQLLATRGYAVLTPDSDIVMSHPVDSLRRSILPAILKAIDLGIADRNAIGVTGHSQGSMSVVALLTQSTIFKAALGTNGYYDLLSFYGSLTPDGDDPGAFVMESYNSILTNPWKGARVFSENSPILQLDRVRTPLLLAHGTADSIPETQGAEVFVGLRRLGQKVTYVQYEGEGHVPFDWTAEHQIDFADRTLAWFDEHLKR